jgi:hypothetical protein
VPVRNGSFPEAPACGHNTHVGTLLDAVPVALPDDPPELAEETALEVRLLDAAPVDAVPAVEPAVVVPVAAGDVDCAAVAVVVFAPVVAVEPGVLLPSVTTPLFVTLYGFAVVCAMAAKKNSTV